ncbi:MAG TPA: hypothetical protein VFC19_20805 [Candidatus Limnocylindrales bacterium]|nr:hypothetical protein [Candidatus Limnocylindrales bacterium]
MHSPVGSWLARVERPSGTAEVGLHFTHGGLVFLVSGAHGVGFWRPFKNIFVYRIREAMMDNDGDYCGYIDILQRGKVTGGRLSSSGESRVYGADEALMRTVSIRINADPTPPAEP